MIQVLQVQLRIILINSYKESRFFGMVQGLPGFSHRFRAALRAISARRALESFFARAAPPFNPPNRPKATAAGFLAGCSVACLTMEAAI
jgi:hypothetical protein